MLNESMWFEMLTHQHPHTLTPSHPSSHTLTHSPMAPTVRLAVEAVRPNWDSRYFGANAVIPDTMSRELVMDMVMKTQLRLTTTLFKWAGNAFNVVRRSAFSLMPYLLLYVFAISFSLSSLTTSLSGSSRGNNRNGMEARRDITPVCIHM